MDRLETAGEPGESLTWVAHPFRRERRRGLAILGVIFAMAVGLSALTRSPFWGVFTVLALGFSLEGFYFPTRYELGAQGVSLQKRFSRSAAGWERFRRCYEDRWGLTLSPYRRKSLLEPYRSIRLLFDGGDRARISARVRQALPAGAEWHGPGDRVEVLPGPLAGPVAGSDAAAERAC